MACPTCRLTRSQGALGDNRISMFQTGFVAKNPAGKRVEGVVCCGVLKACTVRF